MFDMAIYNRMKILIAQKEFKEKRKLTYRVIAEETGLSIGTITSYLTQRAGRFDAPTLEKLCNYFDCQPGDLLTYSETPPKEK